MERNWTKEPWAHDKYITNPEEGLKPSGTYIFEAYEDDGPIGEFDGEGDGERAVACVNACAAFDDPEKSVRAMRTALEIVATCVTSPNSKEYLSPVMAKALAARALDAAAGKGSTHEGK